MQGNATGRKTQFILVWLQRLSGSVSNVLHRIQIISVGISCTAGDGLKTHHHQASPGSLEKLHKVTYIGLKQIKK